MYILRTAGFRSYIVAGPRKNKKEGACISNNQFDAMQFKTLVAAKDWLVAVKDTQRAFGFKGYELTKAYPILAKHKDQTK